jgi:pyrroline-5-carboxylate reductase
MLEAARDEPSTGRLAVLGAGKMASTLLEGLLGAGLLEASQVAATTRHPHTAREVAQRLGIAAGTDNRAAAAGADTVLLGVKPQTLPEVLAEIAPVLAAGQLVVSIVASASTVFIEERLAPEVSVVRAMPNTPSMVGAGMTVLAGGRRATAEELERAERLFRAVGRTLRLDEKHMDAVTALSASGPAFIYVVLEALAEGGVKVGLPRQTATVLAAQACLGAAKMVLDTGEHPALLKDAVTTPAGCTIDGLLELEAGGLRVTLIKAVVEAARRAGGLLGA